MSEFNEGDLVEAVKGETVIRGRVADKGYFFQDGPSLVAYRDRGFTFTLIEAAPKPLPIEPGTVIKFDSQFAVWQLFKNGEWMNTVTGKDAPHAAEQLAIYGNNWRVLS